MTGQEIELPHQWQARDYQLPLWRYLRNGGKRAVAVWHRRAGKDDVCLHWTAIAAMGRPAMYWHMLPEAAQARKAIWDAVNPHTGKRRIDEAFPLSIRKRTVGNEMKIEFLNGSIWQVVGSDNYNSLVGSPPAGVVFSEWALADPAAWAYIRPILKENGGWALFIYTPRGMTHGAKFYEARKADAEWFVQRLTAHDTGVFTAQQLEQERKEYVADYGEQDGETRFNQEYLCDFAAAVIGSYYGKQMRQADEDKRITTVPWSPKLPVTTAWDIGVRDSTAIWFVQQMMHEVRVIDYYENSGVGAEHYAKVLKDKPYAYRDHIWPHDVGHDTFVTGDTVEQTLRQLELHNGRVLPQSEVKDGIQAVRNLLPRCIFDATKCARGIEALKQYRREWDDAKKAFRDKPLHDWTSHPADAFRYLAQGLRPPGSAAAAKPILYPNGGFA